MIWTYRTLFALLGAKQRRRFALIVLLMMAVAVLDLAGVAMIIPFLAVIANPEVAAEQPLLRASYEAFGFASTQAFLLFLGSVTFVLVMAGIAVRALSFYLAALFARQVNVFLGMARLRSYLFQPYEWFLQRHSAELAKSVLQEIHEIINGSLAPALRLIANGFSLLLLIGLLLAIEPIGAIGIAIVFGAGFWSVDRAVQARIVEMGMDRRRANRERHQIAGEVLSGIKEAKVMGLEQTYLDRFEAPSRRLAAYQAMLNLMGEIPRYALEALTFGGMLTFTLWLLWTNDGRIEEIVPVLGAFAFAALRLMPTAQMFFRDVTQMRFSQAALGALRDDLLTQAPAGPAPPRDAVPMRLRRSISVENVTYLYPDSDEPSLRDISFEIGAGQTVGFMGATGAGKSTLIDLMLGLVLPAKGSIAIDGRPLNDNNRMNWQRSVGFVPQSIFLADDTVAANIAHGVADSDIDMDRVRSAARQARVAEFVDRMPERYDTRIGDKGLRLSGGQKQRLAIARALYRHQDVLVLDEATSALDPVTESEVMQAIRGLHGSKTILLVSHRLSTLAHCDFIFVLKEGRLIARGSYSDLASGNDEFRAMFTAAE